jgi:hypothetical protein
MGEEKKQEQGVQAPATVELKCGNCHWAGPVDSRMKGALKWDCHGLPPRYVPIQQESPITAGLPGGRGRMNVQIVREPVLVTDNDGCALFLARSFLGGPEQAAAEAAAAGRAGPAEGKPAEEKTGE